MKTTTTLARIRFALCLLVGLSLGTQALAQLARAPESRGAHHDHHHDDLDGLLNEYDKEIHFVENKGQFSEPVLFRADLPMGQAVATREGMVITAFDPASIAEFQRQGILIEEQIAQGLPYRTPQWHKKGHSWRLNFLGGSSRATVESRTAHDVENNYFKGGSEALGVRSFQEVWYRNTYPGIDVRYYPAEDGSLEYDIICQPGSDPAQVAIAFDGIDRIHVNGKGELVLATSLGEMTYPAPVVYQRANGKERSVKSAYVVEGKNTLRFRLGDYDKSEPLVIDPIALRWATWMNTASQTDNHGHCIWVDQTDGAIYVVSRVSGGTDQITTGAFDETINGSYDMVVGKYYEPATIGGSGTRVWQTYIGGNGIENPYAMEQGPDGHLYITGYTSSTNFPMLGGPDFSGSSVNQQAQSGDDVYVVKINQAGNSIKSAVVGGNGTDYSFDLRIAANGDVIVGGHTTSGNLATVNSGSGATNSNAGAVDVLIFRINQDLSAVQWMRNYGGSSDDLAQIMLYDPATDNIFVGGRTKSTNFPTLNPRQSTRGGSEAGFLQRLTGTGTTLWSSYFQSSSNRNLAILCMSMSTSGNEFYFGGVTSGAASSNISSGAYDETYNGGSNDLFVARMDIDQNFIGGTYVGGSSNEVNMMGLNTDQNNDVYVFGYTNSTNFPVSTAPNTPVQPSNNGSNDKVFFKLSADLSNLIFSTYYGGSGDDYDPVGERGIKFSNCRIYTIITSLSNNIPLTQGAINTTKNSNQYEPGIVVWANPPDLLGNTITGSQSVCAGSVPSDIQGSVPAYVLPTLVRNNAPSAHPSLGAATTYQWQISVDSLAWTDIPGATNQHLAGSMIGEVNEKTYVRRIIGGDACILAGAADQVVTVKLIEATADITHVSCHGANDGAITASSTGVGPFTYAWSHGPTGATITGLAPGTYTVEVTDNNGCQAQESFVVTQPDALSGVIQGIQATCNNHDGAAQVNIIGGTTPYSYAWSNGATGSSASNLAPGSYTVDIVDANGCHLQLSVTIGATGTPGASAGGDKIITCSMPQVILDGSSPGNNVSFAWSAGAGGNIVSGASTASPVVNAAGSYTLTVTDNNTGCHSTDQVNVTMDTTAPNASATVDGDLSCSITSIVLNGGSTTPGATFSWSNGNGFSSTEEDPTVSEPGTYVLTVTDPANGCTSTATAEVGMDNELPGAQAAGGTLSCLVSTVQLQGSGNGSFAWSGPNGFTSTDQNPVVSEAGTYTLIVTGTNGCTSTATAEVGMDNDLPGAQAAGGTLSCLVSTVQLQGSGNGSFAWSGPNGFASADQNPVVSEAGTYTLVVTGTNGCSSTATAEVGMDNELPGAQAAGGTLSCLVSTVQLQGSGNGSFAWSGTNGFTSTDQNPVVSEAGTYTLVVTGTNGCTSTATAEVGMDNELPGAQAAGGTLSCLVSTVQLQGSGNGSFAWSGPNGFTSTDQNPVVSEAGTYTLIVTGTNGCTSTATAEVGMDNDLPGAQAAGGTLSCLVSTVQLHGTGNGTYAWSGPNGFTSTEQNPVVSEAGTYTLVVTGTNGCTSTATAEVGMDNDLPGAQAAGGTLSCNVASVMLQGSGNGSFAWTGPNGFTSTDQNPEVSEAGTYTLVVTGTNGCTSTATAEVGMDNELPGAQAAGGTLSCLVSTVQLQGSGNGSFAWSGPNGFTSTDQNPVVSEAGTYTLVVTGTNGCTSTATAEVGMDNELPGAQAAGGTLSCNVASVMLQGSGNGSFAWTGPNGFTSTEQNPVVSEAGTYTLIVTGTNGCTSTATAEVGMDNDLPGAQAAGGTLSCNVASVMLQGSGNGSFAWTGPNGFTSTEQNPVVSEAGTYTLVVTGTNGCTSTATAEVGMDNELPGAQAAGGTLSCLVSTVQLQGSGNGSFAWSGPNGFASADQNPVVSEAGTYTLVVTGTNGCTSTATAEVGMDNDLPGAQAAGGTLSCNVTSVMLQGSGNGTYAWSGPNGFTSTEQNPVVSEAGTYTLVVTGTNGCTSTATAEVGMDNELPGAQAAGGTLSCLVSTVQLQGSGNGSFAWSGPNGFASADQNPVVSEAGTYTLVVTGTNGCTSTATAEVGMDNELPGAQAAGGTLSCLVSTVQLQGSGNGSFAWSGPNGFTSTDQNPVVSEAGTYTLVVTGTNGCTSTATAEVGMDNELPGAQAAGGTLSCLVSTVQLQGSGNGSFAWSGPNGFASADQNPVVSEAGTYTLVVTGTNGCSSTATAEVGMDNDLPGAQAAGGTLSCNVASVMLQGSGNGSFAWTGPNGFTSTEQNPVVSEAGTYTLIVTGTNGCTSTATAEVGMDNDLPGAQAAGGTLSCLVSTVQLHGTGNGTYAWSGPNGFTSTEQNPVVSEAGTYTLIVTGTNGCTSTATAEVGMDNDLPGAQAAGGTLSCLVSTVQLHGTGNGTYAWSGPNGFTSTEQNPVVSEAGTYTLIVTGTNGCTSTATAEVGMDNDLPGAQAAGGTLSCNVTSVMLQGSGNGTYAWSGPNGFASIEQNPVVSEAGTYTLIVTGTNGCTSTATAEVGMDNDLPGAQAAGGTLSCLVSTVQLQGSGNGSFAWSGPNGFTSTEQNPVVSEAGTYTLVVTGTNGCTSTATAEVGMDNELPGAQAAGGTLSCLVSTVQLQGSGNGSFAWSGPNGFASADQNPVVSEAGTYTLVVTGTNGCTSTATAEVGMDNDLPGAQAAGGTLSCNVTSVMLQGSGNGTYAWSGPNGFASTEQNPVVSEAGTYTLIVTGTNGCTSTATAEVGMDNDLPGAQAAGGTLSCNVTSVMLQGSGNGTYAWSGPNGFASTEQNPVVSEAGTYTLIVTGTNGCTSTATAEVGMDNELPGAQAAGGLIDCETQTATLAGSGNGSFAWSGPNGFISNLQNPVVSTAGLYTLTVTGGNGCTSTATAEVFPQECDGCDAPIIIYPGPDLTTVECGNSIDPLDIGYPITRKDPDCPEVVHFSYYDEFSGSCPIIVMRHWTFQDVAGNEETSVQIIHIVDTQAPVLMNLPADTTVMCDEVPEAPNNVWAADCKNNVEVTVTDVLIPGDDWTTYTIERTFTAEDACDNLAFHTQVITVIGCKKDCEAPIIIYAGPDLTTVECGSSIDPFDIGYPITRKDPDCPEVVHFSYYDEFSGSCPIIVTRHWTFQDVDGNEETSVQIIHIVDTQAPVLSCTDSEITVHCDAIPEPFKCTATDNCTDEVEVTFSETSTKGDCKSGYTLTRTYTATDDCGNTATAVQTIHVEEGAQVTTKMMGATPHITNLSVAPNPFRHQSTIRFTSEVEGHARVIITDMLGHQVAALFDGEVAKGMETAVEFRPESTSGGLFFYRITLNGQAETGKIMYRP